MNENFNFDDRIDVPLSARMSDLFDAVLEDEDESLEEGLVGYDTDIAAILCKARNSTESIRDFCNREFRRQEGEPLHITPDELQDILTVRIIDEAAWKKEETMEGVRNLLNKENAVTDATDRAILEKALAAIAVPMENPVPIASSVGEVIGGYQAKGETEPPELTMLNKHLQIQQTGYFLRMAEAAIAKNPQDPKEIKAATGKALHKYMNTVRYLQDASLREQALALCRKTNALFQYADNEKDLRMLTLITNKAHTMRNGGKGWALRMQHAMSQPGVFDPDNIGYVMPDELLMLLDMKKLIETGVLPADIEAYTEECAVGMETLLKYTDTLGKLSPAKLCAEYVTQSWKQLKANILRRKKCDREKARSVMLISVPAIVAQPKEFRDAHAEYEATVHRKQLIWETLLAKITGKKNPGRKYEIVLNSTM